MYLIFRDIVLLRPFTSIPTSSFFVHLSSFNNLIQYRLALLVEENGLAPPKRFRESCSDLGSLQCVACQDRHSCMSVGCFKLLHEDDTIETYACRQARRL